MTKFEKFQRTLISFLFILAAFFMGWYLGKRGYVYEIRRHPPKIEIVNKAPLDQTVDFGLFWEVWNMVSADYLERPVDGQKMLHGAIQGMVNSLGDPYTSFLPPTLNETINNALNGTYEGIGAELGIEDGQLIIISPLDGSPAKAAGLRSRDKILKIEETSTVGITVTEAVSKIRGAAGTVATLTIQRDAEEPFVVRIRRGQISIDSVTWADKGNGIAYIRVSRFGADTNTEWSKVAAEVNVQMDSLDTIVLDLRGNPGGYMLSAVHIAGEFYKDDVVTYQESATGELTPLETKRVGVFNDIPVYILIDGGSASASEILAGALKSKVGAILVGEKSFGKGTIQEARDFEDGSGLHLTIAKWLTPDKVWVHKEGIKPDVEVTRTAEEIEATVDSQLDKALELINQGIVNVSDLKNVETKTNE